MIKAATPEHLEFMSGILRSGAIDGSWDPALQHPGLVLNALLAKLHGSLLGGFLRQVDPRTGKVIDTRIAGYVYCPAPGEPPIGFALFKDFSESGFEIWLLGIDEPWRGKGHGRAIVTEVLATPLGERTEFARCALASDPARRVSRILKSNGFATCRTTATEEWLLHRRTPAPVRHSIMHLDMTPFEAALRRSVVSPARIIPPLG